MTRPFLHDTWSPLSYVEGLGDGHHGALPPGMPTVGWLDPVDARRLMAYRILAAKRDNVSRYYLPEKMWQTGVPGDHLTELDRVRYLLAAVDRTSPAEKLREYGDAQLLVEQGVSLLLGDDQTIVLPELSDLEQADDTAADPEGGQPAEDARIGVLRTFDDWLQEWADQERLVLRLMELEENAVGDGDGVCALGWSEQLGRPRLRVYDPGWYFPNLDTIGDDEEYPTTVHVAWEVERDDKTWLHRKTWRLLKVGDGDPLAPAAPYRPAYAEDQTDRVCVYSVSEWDTALLRTGESVYTLSDDDPRAKVIVDPISLGVDFLPVVHVPNDAAGKRHFGRSILLSVAQVLDDVASTDTDLQANSELVGSTPMVTTGAGSFQPEAGPGAVHNLPDGGDAKLLDTSRALLGLTGYSRHLRSTVSVNSRVAEALLGRVSPSDVPSGYAFDLGFTPTRSLVRKMRLVRAEKYPLLLKMAMRLTQVHGDGLLPAGPAPRAELLLGGYLPADKAGAMTRVKDGLTAHAISTRTGVQILVEADYPIEDAEAEVDRIRAEAVKDLVAIVDALGAEGLPIVRERLGLNPVAPPVPPVPPGPPAPDDGTGGAT